MVKHTYDGAGNITKQMQSAEAVGAETPVWRTVEYTYDEMNRVTSLTNTMTNATGEKVVISAFAYTYYADGNQQTKTETMLGGDPVTTTYVYDEIGRLSAEPRARTASPIPMMQAATV